MRTVLLALLLFPLAALAEYPSERAFFFHFAAVQADLPELCAKISPGMQYTAGFNPPGYQIYALRSKCYYDTALRHRRPQLCDEVQAVSTPVLSGSKISAEHCRARVGSHVQVATPLTPKRETLLQLFAEMGYTADNMAHTLPMHAPSLTPVQFLNLQSRPDIRQRVLAALRAPQDMSRDDLDALHEMAGVLTHDIAWCRSIDPARQLANDKPQGSPHLTWNMANWCIFKIAFNTDNATLCELLPKTHAPELTPLYSLAGQCRAQLAAFHDPKNTARRSHYGFNPLPEAAQRARLYGYLGYAVPHLADLPPEEIARRLRDLLRDIGSGRVARQDPQVQALLDKLKSLPE